MGFLYVHLQDIVVEDIGYVNQEGKGYVAVTSKTQILLDFTTTKVFLTLYV